VSTGDLYFYFVLTCIFYVYILRSAFATRKEDSFPIEIPIVHIKHRGSCLDTGFPPGIEISSRDRKKVRDPSVEC